jgi:hypothetical protein
MRSRPLQAEQPSIAKTMRKETFLLPANGAKGAKRSRTVFALSRATLTTSEETVQERCTLL